MLRVDEHVHDLKEEMRRLSGEDLAKCIQCGKCTAGCPIAPDMDVMPNQVMRYLQLNEAGKALGAASIWLCASCTTCSVRCPEGIDVARVMNQARKLCVERGYRPGERRVPLFNRLFVDSIRRGGRVHELGIVMRYNALTRKPDAGYRPSAADPAEGEDQPAPPPDRGASGDKAALCKEQAVSKRVGEQWR